MTLGVAEASDLTAIAALERGAFAHAAWSERAWAEELSAGNRRVWVYRDAAGALCGVATFALAGDVVDLLRVIVAPDARGRGLGRSLVRAGLVWASEVGAERVMLEVDAANAPALALYRGLGFEAIATRTGYYGPGADAVIMSRDVAPADGPGAASGESETEKKVEA
ncbi:GNAT family N-acetyltransferase [Nigerium sp.]|uniref:GNAT family N-acetyltransferase n=1 Tax=Nigerium sp. TaxID=2042655 RepID=UPI0032217375